MSNYNLEETILIEKQMVLSVLSLFLIFVSLFLSYNEVLKLRDEAGLFDEDEENYILIFNRILGVLLGAGFLYINILDKQVKDRYDRYDNNANLQIWASVLTVLASLIVLYVALKGNDGVIDIENPND